MAFDQGNNAYCSVADIAAAMGGFTVPVVWTDTKQEDAIIAATQEIDGLTGTHFGNTDLTMELSGESDALLRLTRFTGWPCISIEEIRFRETYDADFDWDNNGVLLDVDSWMISLSRHALNRIQGDSLRVATTGLLKAIWQKGEKNYRIKGAFGLEEIPEPIIAACILMVRDEITPGTSLAGEIGLSEKFQDGYAIQRRATSGGLSEIPVMTGSMPIDRRLYKFVYDVPMMVSIE